MGAPTSDCTICERVLGVKRNVRSPRHAVKSRQVHTASAFPLGVAASDATGVTARCNMLINVHNSDEWERCHWEFESCTISYGRSHYVSMSYTHEVHRWHLRSLVLTKCPLFTYWIEVPHACCFRPHPCCIELYCSYMPCTKACSGTKYHQRHTMSVTARQGMTAHHLFAKKYEAL